VVALFLSGRSEPPGEPVASMQANASSTEDDAPQREAMAGSGTAPPTATSSEDAAPAELMGRLRTQSFHVVYERSGGPEGGTIHTATQIPPRFGWRTEDAAGGDRALGQHLIEESEDSVVSCLFVGAGGDDAVEEWECARTERDAAEPPLLDEVYGDLLFGSFSYTPEAVDAQGWTSAGERTHLDRPATCGTSPAFVQDIVEVCIDEALGVPVLVEYDDGTVIEALEVRSPSEDDLDPPSQPWEGTDG
jgi:hypothetical protein